MKGRGINIISNILNILAILLSIILTTMIPVLGGTNIENSALNYLALTLLILFNIYSIIRVREITIKIIDAKKLNLELYPVIISTYLLGIITSVIVFQFDFGQINLILSFLFLFFAIGNVIYGFIKKYTYIRLFGLGLSLFSTGKLFLWDLRHLTMGGKIIAYFGFGIVLILISFIYQKINKEITKDDIKEV